MYGTVRRQRDTGAATPGRCVARERAPAYVTGAVGEPAAAERAAAAAAGAAGALAKIREGLAELAAADAEQTTAGELGEVLLGLVDVQERLAAQESRLLEVFARRADYRHDACVTVPSWLHWRTRLGWGQVHRRVARARLLARCPALREALQTGMTTTAHVDAVVRRATANRVERIVEHEQTLAELACTGEPRDVAVAVARIVELVDPDGADDPPVCKQDDLRELHVRRGLGDLRTVDGVATTQLGELLLRVRDLYSTPDAPDTPAEQRRSAPQRFHDALRDALTVALEHHPGARVDGVKTHVVVFADLRVLLGEDQLAAVQSRVGSGATIDPDTVRHLLATSPNPTARLVLGLGPWLPVSVGRAKRVLPAWLRGASQLLHRHCQGPGCDRPFSWTEADHAKAWAQGGETGLLNDVPECDEHHDLKHDDGWTVRYDPLTGTVTWISRDGTRRFDIPAPER